MSSTINALTSGGGLAMAGDTSGVLALQSAGTTFATGNQYGIGLGTAVPSSGIGLAFPATQSASTDANTLDDYEEGTWTPTDASGAGLSFTVATGTYTKVGNLVFLTFIAIYPSNASSSSATVGGFPFISGSNGGNSFGGFVTLTNSSLSFTPFMGNSSSQTVFRTTASVSITNVQLSGWSVRVSMLYQAA